MVSYRTDRTTLFRLSTNDERADVRNNVFYVTAAGSTLSLVDATGILDLTHNWFKPGRVATFGTLTGTINDDGTSIVGSSPGFRDEPDRTSAWRLARRRPTRGRGLAPALLPEPGIARQYVKHQNSEVRPNDGVFDLGAFEMTDGQVPNLVITTSSLPGGTVGTAYGAFVSATGGLAPYAWTIVAGSLPAGLSLNAASGAISGTPSMAGSSAFTVQVTDGQVPADVATAALSITVAAAPAPNPLAITTTSLPNARRNKNYNRTLAATGGTAPYAWAIIGGSLPPGLSLNANTGVISGRATTLGQYSFTARVADSQADPDTDRSAVDHRHSMTRGLLTLGAQTSWTAS